MTRNESSPDAFEGNLARRLESFEAPAPPDGLLEAIRDEIPESLSVATSDTASSGTGADGVAGSATGNGAAVPPARRRNLLRIAAVLAIALVGGALAWQVAQRNDSEQLTEAVQEPPISSTRSDVPAPVDDLTSEASPSDALTTPTSPLAVSELPAPPQGSRPPLQDESLETERLIPRSEAPAVPVPGRRPQRVPSPDPTPTEPVAGDTEAKVRAPQADDAFLILPPPPPPPPPPAAPQRSREARQLAESMALRDGRSQQKLEDAEAAAPSRPEATASSSIQVEVPNLAAEDSNSVRGGNLKEAQEELADELAALDYVGGGAAAPSTGGTAEPNDQPYGDVFYESAGVNPFIDTEDDRLSTFGLDVDTGSWGVVRRYLRDGNLPPADAVRVEEIVNAFDYGYAPPEEGTFAISVAGAPTPFTDTQRTRLLRIGVQGREISAANRKPVTLVFVVDVSGSMSRDDRLGLVRESLHLLLDNLSPQDRVGLVVYGSHGQVIQSPTGDLRRLRAAIDRLIPEGSTNAEEGLALAYDLMKRYQRPGAIHRLILCSDGVANVGATGPESILARVRGAADDGIELTTLGFGMGNYNDHLMEQLANQGDGRYAYLDTLEDAHRLFVEELTGTLQTIAAETKAQVEFDPRHVERWRLLGYENRDIADHDFRNDAVDAGEIGAGHTVTALYEVKLSSESRRSDRLGTVRLRYRNPETERFEEIDRPIHGRDLDSSFRSASPSLRFAAIAAEFAEILRGSYWAKGSSLSALHAEAQALTRSLRSPDLADLTDQIARARAIEQRTGKGVIED